MEGHYLRDVGVFRGNSSNKITLHIRQEITSAGKDVEKRKLLCTVGGNVVHCWCSHCGKQDGDSWKR